MCFFSFSLVTRGGGVSDRVHWNKHTPRFLHIAIKHCVIHLLRLTIIFEQINLFQFFLKFKLARFVSIASDLQNWKEFLLPWKVALRANYHEDKKKILTYSPAFWKKSIQVFISPDFRHPIFFQGRDFLFFCICLFVFCSLFRSYLPSFMHKLLSPFFFKVAIECPKSIVLRC